MVRELRSEVEIAAAPVRVWRVLVDFASYPNWNPFILSIDGAPTVGGRLVVTLRRGTDSTVRFRPRLLACREGSELRWLGQLIVPGLFDGEHVFELSPVGTHATRLVQRETFRGLLVPLLWRTLERETLPRFREMNEALRARVESLPP